jgi:hypothetical protein
LEYVWQTTQKSNVKTIHQVKKVSVRYIKADQYSKTEWKVVFRFLLGSEKLVQKRGVYILFYHGGK